MTIICTASLGKKANLRKFLETWRGRKFTDDELKGFELAKLAGLGCLITLVHSERNGAVYANIEGCAKLPKGMPEMRAENELLVYDIDQPVPQTLPEWIRKKIEASAEKRTWTASGAREHEPPPPSELYGGDGDDEIPF